MLEVIALFYLWRKFKIAAIEKGQPPLKYQITLLICWFSFEMIGSMIGLLLFMYLVPSVDPLLGAYFSCLPGAIFGGVFAWRLLQKAPNIKKDKNSTHTTHIYNLMPEENEDSLTLPATLHIIEEFGETTDRDDVFILNGHIICSLKPGCEYTMRTFYRKNVIQIAGTNSEIKFIASDNGYVEIHAANGMIIPELFKNYTSK